MNMLAQMTWFQWFVGASIIAVCAILLLIVLIQRGRGQGLAGAFGGGGGGGGAFGAKTGDVFTLITVGLAAVFLFLNIVGNFAFDQTPTRQPDSAANPALPAAPTDAVPAEGESTTGSGSEAPKAADQPDATTDDSGTKTQEPGAGGGSNKG